MDIVIIVLLILFNGVFAMSEMSLVSSKKFVLENAIKRGKSGAKSALKLMENPNKFLSTIQIGITLIGILLGVYSGKNLTDDMAAIIENVSFLKPYADTLAAAIIVILITFFSLILGELLPKRIGLTFPENIAMVVSRPMKVLSFITSPFVWLLSVTNDLLLGILGIKNNRQIVSEEEIKSLLRESAEDGEIQHIEQDIVERVFELGDRKVNKLLTHRSDIVYFDIQDDKDTILKKIANDKHSTYPVCKDNNLDNLLGVVLLKDLFSLYSDTNFDLYNYIKEPIYVNENTFAYKVLELFKNHRKHHAIVVDEYGVTQGIITMDDMLDALVGDSTEMDQDEYTIFQRDDTSWLVDGQFLLVDFVKYFQLEIDEDVLNQYTTVAGLIIYLEDDVPNIGEKTIMGDYSLEVIDKDGQRIDKILVSKINHE